MLIVGEGVIRNYFCLVRRQTHLGSPLELWVRQAFLANSIGQYTSSHPPEPLTFEATVAHSARSAPFFDFGAATAKESRWSAGWHQVAADDRA